MRPEVACSRRCGAVAPDAETALSLRWEHIPPDWWGCAECEARDAAAVEELLASLEANRAAFGGGR